jgi:hypothetical protein
MMRGLLWLFVLANGAIAVAQTAAEKPTAAPPAKPIQFGLGHDSHASWEGTRSKLPDLAVKAGDAIVEPDGTLSWKALGKITTIRRENTDKRYGPYVAYFAEPVVSGEVKALVGKKVKVRGYALPRGTTDGITRILVSGRPAADADGCTSGGAETFVDVRVQNKTAPPVDTMLLVEGTLALFDVENWGGFIYQLTDVRIVTEGA